MDPQGPPHPILNLINICKLGGMPHACVGMLFQNHSGTTGGLTACVVIIYFAAKFFPSRDREGAGK